MESDWSQTGIGVARIYSGWTVSQGYNINEMYTERACKVLSVVQAWGCSMYACGMDSKVLSAVQAWGVQHVCRRDGQ